MSDIKFKGLDKALKKLDRFGKSIPYALAGAANEEAFLARREWSNEIQRTMQTRNQYVARAALKVDKASPRGSMEVRAVLGSTAPFMGDVESGHSKTRKAFPTGAAAGQAPNAKRTQVVRSKYKLGALHAYHPPRGRSQKQQFAIAASMARKGQKFAVLDRPRGGGKGLYEFTGSRRKMRARLVYSIGRAPASVAAHPTLEPVLARLRPQFERIAEKHVVAQLKRAMR